jgi:hypothetical protein
VPSAGGMPICGVPPLPLEPPFLPKRSSAVFQQPELTGLEPATSAVTGRRSNQLSYNSSEKVVKLELNLGGFNRKFLSYALSGHIAFWTQPQG